MRGSVAYSIKRIFMYELDEKTKQKIIAVISALIPEARIYLFGSRARGSNAQYADIDIALDAGKPLPLRDIDEVKSMFGESNIPYKIDVVDIHQVNDRMRQQIMKERVIWK
jgi:predicted nucleotidyltransferase